MKGHISPEKIEEVKRRADIFEIVSEYVTLKKGGRNFLGLCPFHKEKTPSFTVNRDKQIFYCFGCGEGGNVITFLMKMNGLSFPEAVRHLAQKTGVIIPERILTHEDKERSSVRNEVSRINQLAAVYYAENLISPAGRRAREYLNDRGIGNDIIKEFRLGFALDGWRHLRDFFEKRKIPLKLVEMAGLIIPKTNGEGSFYDRFRGRLIFPIEDVAGNVIAFGGRIIGDGEPKYLNTSESPVYVKGRNLYGLNRTKEEIRKKGYAIFVEGYFDLISLWNGGIRNVIATLGTALTREHVDLIRRYTGQIVVVFDPDVAGKKAMARSIELFLSGNLHAKTVVLPNGHDPDTYVRKYGGSAFIERVTGAQSMVDYYIENVIGSVATLEKKKDALRESVSLITHIENASERDLFIQRVSEKLGLNQELLTKEVNDALKKSFGKGASVSGKHESEVDMVELSLIHTMLEYPHKIPEIVQLNVFDCFMSETLKSLALRLKDAFEKEGASDFDATLFIQSIDNESIRQKLLKKMVDEGSYEYEIVDRVVVDAVKRIKQKWYKEQYRILGIEIKKAEERGNHKLCEKLLTEKERLRKEQVIL